MDFLNKITISPEPEIVFRSIRIDHAYDSRIEQLLGGSVDWSVIREFALQQGVLPQLFLRLKFLQDNLDSNIILGDQMAKLQELYLANAQRNLRLSRMLIRVINLLSVGGIECMPLKGPTMAVRLYGDTSLRHFSDLDILIQRKDFRRCYQLLMEAGFTPKTSIQQKEEAWLLKADTECQFSYQNDFLEIHWAIAEKGVQYPLKETIFWEQRYHIDFYGCKVLSLSPDNLILLLCIHGTKHGWGRLSWIADIAHFSKAYPDFNWSAVLESAEKIGFYRVVCLGLHLAESLGGAKLPRKINSMIHSDPLIEQLASEAGKNLLGINPVTEKSQVAYYLRSRERRKDQTYFILDQAFTPKQIDWQTISLPAVLYPLYYLIRPLRLFFKLIITPIIQRKTKRTSVIF